MDELFAVKASVRFFFWLVTQEGLCDNLTALPRGFGLELRWELGLGSSLPRRAAAW